MSLCCEPLLRALSGLVWRETLALASGLCRIVLHRPEKEAARMLVAPIAPLNPLHPLRVSFFANLDTFRFCEPLLRASAASSVWAVLARDTGTHPWPLQNSAASPEEGSGSHAGGSHRTSAHEALHRTCCALIGGLGNGVESSESSAISRLPRLDAESPMLTHSLGSHRAFFEV